MIDRSKLSNSFEFVVTSGARARQLMRGAAPRVPVGQHKNVTLAQQEVVTGLVERIEPGAEPHAAGASGGEPEAGGSMEG